MGSKQRLLLMIQLAMSIPGFSNLPLSDQIALIKGINPALDEQLLSFFAAIYHLVV